MGLAFSGPVRNRARRRAYTINRRNQVYPDKDESNLCLTSACFGTRRGALRSGYPHAFVSMSAQGVTMRFQIRGGVSCDSCWRAEMKPRRIVAVYQVCSSGDDDSRRCILMYHCLYHCLHVTSYKNVSEALGGVSECISSVSRYRPIVSPRAFTE